MLITTHFSKLRGIFPEKSKYAPGAPAWSSEFWNRVRVGQLKQLWRYASATCGRYDVAEHP